MTLYEKNLELLKEQGFDLKDFFSLPPGEDGTVKLLRGTGNCYTATQKIMGADILLHSSIDPQKEARRMLSREDYSRYGTVFALGLGLGYHIQELLKQTNPKCVLYVLESDWEVIRAAMEVQDFEELLATRRVVLAFGSFTDVRILFDGLFAANDLLAKFYNIGFFYYPLKYRFEFDWVKEMQNLILDRIRYHRYGVGLDIGWSVIGLTNLTAHASYIAKSPAPIFLKQGWKHPVVIVLAGPSLSKNIHVLREWQDQVTIFCINTSLKKLLDNGIVPDATFSLDRGEIVFEHYNVNSSIPESILFIGSPVIDLRIVELFKHNMFLIHYEDEFQVELAGDIDGREGMAAGLSVTHFVYVFARFCGASPIILIGQDLAFGGDGHTHSAGTIYEENKIELGDQPGIIYLDGYFEGKVPSTTTWKAFRDWYEIELTKFPTLIINATEGGAKIHGTVQLSLREALEQYVGTGCTNKESFLDWINDGINQMDYDLTVEKIRKSFLVRKQKLMLYDGMIKRALKLGRKASSPTVSPRLKERYVNDLIAIQKEIFADRWVMGAYRPEYVRVMTRFYEILAGDEPGKHMQELIELLLGMFGDLRKLLEKLSTILAEAVTDLESGKNSQDVF